MAVGVGASGFIGVAVETTPGTYIAPTHYLPLLSEDLNYVQDTNWRRPLRGIADVAGATAGYARVEGSINVEITHDTLPQLLRCARATCVKTGAGPYVYTFTPSQVAVPAKTMSITVVRNGVAFGYVGCIIGSQEYTIDSGQLNGTFSILGTDEANQAVPTPTYVTTSPFAAGQYSLEIPFGSVVTDADTFTLSIEDNPEAQYRIKNNKSAQFIKLGERSVSLSIARDFESRTDYDAFKALTAQRIVLTATSGANSVKFDVKAAIKESYPISGLSGQADLIRADISYQGVYSDADSKSYEIVVNSSASITIP